MNNTYSITQYADHHNYNILLDCLRVFAMLGVLTVHLTCYIAFPEWIAKLMVYGKQGVPVFFVLSGYLIAFSLCRKQTGICAFYKKRALRILPTYYTAICFAIIYHEFIVDNVPYSPFNMGWLLYFTGLNHVIPNQEYDPGGFWTNIYGWWAMSCFIWFYILAPFILRYVNTFNKSIIFVIATLITKYVISGSDHFAIGVLPMLWFFAFGISTYWAIQEKKVQIFCSYLLFMVFGSAILSTSYESFKWICSDVLVALLTCLYIQINANYTYTSKKLISRIVQFLAKYSFSVYIVHLFIYSLSDKISRYIFASLDLQENIVLFTFLFIFIAFSGIIIACYFMEKLQQYAIKIFSTQKTSTAN